MPHYGDYQNEIYGGGLQGVLPRLPVDFKTLEERVASALPPSVLSYVQGGCGDEWTQRHNALTFAAGGLCRVCWWIVRAATCRWNFSACGFRRHCS